MTILQKLAVVFVTCVILAWASLSQVAYEGTLGFYARWTFRVVGTVAALAWFSVWWLSFDRSKWK
ncbi:MAG: hypothetical protein AAFX56_12755 [Pseudomonadota bacterium]